MKRDSYFLIFILILVGLALWAILPTDSTRLGRNGFQLGLDLKGGTHLVYQADLSKKDPSQTDEQVMAAVKAKIERRANSYGVTEPLIQISGEKRIVVELPGITDVDAAINIIGQVAQMEIREAHYDSNGNPVLDAEGNTQWFVASALGSDGVTQKELTGKYLKPNAQVVLDQTTNRPQVAFEWNDEGAVLFKAITARNLNKPISIFLDETNIETANVQNEIGAKGVITGLALKDCQNLVIQLNSGSLDVPLTIVQRTDVDATLGSDSLTKSLIAGAIGIGIVIAFMIFYYHLPGVIAATALLIYSALVLAVYKLIPVTLTLPGIAGFIISVGMAVDANVLIFERLKEELRTGRTLHRAVDEGFRRAWPAIRDSNISTFITCAILYWFGSTFGAFMVKGFALTLFLGVAISMFSAVVITRTFISLLIGGGMVKGLSIHEVKKNV
ncbi:MAG: protein translocase subunit SecD [Dehalococcoidia bacterium]|nr:MAG: protein translocase subunit SecD [Dehalococcoidia bacterium]